MLMFFMAGLGLLQGVRAFLLFATVRNSEPLDTLVTGVLCLAVAEVIRRQNRIVNMGDEEKEVTPNRAHPLAKPQRARPSVPALPADK